MQSVAILVLNFVNIAVKNEQSIVSIIKCVSYELFARVQTHLASCAVKDQSHIADSIFVWAQEKLSREFFAIGSF
jgi:hypothetical protein